MMIRVIDGYMGFTFSQLLNDTITINVNALCLRIV